MACFLSSIASAAVNVGIFAPAIAYLFNIGELQTKVKVIDLLIVDGMILIVVLVTILAARKSLEGIEDKPEKPNSTNKKRK